MSIGRVRTEPQKRFYFALGFRENPIFVMVRLFLFRLSFCFLLPTLIFSERYQMSFQGDPDTNGCCSPFPSSLHRTQHMGGRGGGWVGGEEEACPFHASSPSPGHSGPTWDPRGVLCSSAPPSTHPRLPSMWGPGGSRQAHLL